MTLDHLNLKRQIFLEQYGNEMEPEHKMVVAMCQETKKMGGRGKEEALDVTLHLTSKQSTHKHHFTCQPI